MNKIKQNEIQEWIKKSAGRNHSFTLLKNAIEEKRLSEERENILVACLLLFRKEEPRETAGYKRLRRLFYQQYEKELSEKLGFGVYTPKVKLQVPDATAFLKGTLRLVREKSINEYSLRKLARIIYETCELRNTKTQRKYSERTIRNQLTQLNDDNHNIC